MMRKIPETDWTLLLGQRSILPGCPVRVQSGRDGNRDLAEQTAQGNNRITRLPVLTVFPSSTPCDISYSLTLILFLFNLKGVFGVFPLVLWEHWGCHQRPDVSHSWGTVTVRAEVSSLNCEVARRRGRRQASNPKLPGYKTCVLASWTKGRPLDQVAMVHHQVEYCGRAVNCHSDIDVPTRWLLKTQRMQILLATTHPWLFSCSTSHKVRGRQTGLHYNRQLLWHWPERSRSQRTLSFLW